VKYRADVYKVLTSLSLDTMSTVGKLVTINNSPENTQEAEQARTEQLPIRKRSESRKAPSRPQLACMAEGMWCSLFSPFLKHGITTFTQTRTFL
jgi:hypothetical protein